MIDYSKPIIVIAGPTASGKSSMALKLAKEFDGYIINADSRQIYKELKTGTAQPTPEKVIDDTWYIDDIKHYLYGFVSAKENYNLFEYQQDVQKILDKEDKLPILVGGTGLYIDCIIHNYDLKDNKKRKSKYSRKQLDKMTVKQLQNLLDKNILERFNNSDRNNPIRLIRAIERGGINRDKGKPLNYLYILLEIKPRDLKGKIQTRVEQMFREGLLEENENLLNNGFDYSLPSMQSIGYQEFNGYFKNEKDLQQVKDEIVLHTLQYSRRQDTWFNRNKDTIKIENLDQASLEITKFLRIS
jgi:tRNA dimethylallyltransferase